MPEVQIITHDIYCDLKCWQQINKSCNFLTCFILSLGSFKNVPLFSNLYLTDGKKPTKKNKSIQLLVNPNWGHLKDDLRKKKALSNLIITDPKLKIMKLLFELQIISSNHKECQTKPVPRLPVHWQSIVSVGKKNYLVAIIRYVLTL